MNNKGTLTLGRSQTECKAVANLNMSNGMSKGKLTEARTQIECSAAAYKYMTKALNSKGMFTEGRI
jgi:hypothetical protein